MAVTEALPALLLALVLLLPPPTAAQTSTDTLEKIENIRLTGGKGSHEGNIEVEVEGEWRFVCDDEFSFPEADAVCRDLGFTEALSFTRNNHFGLNSPEWRRSSPKFWFDRVSCSNSTSFRNCSSAGLGQHDCGPTEVAGVRCRQQTSPCEPQQFPCASSSSCRPRSDVCDGFQDCGDSSDEAEDLCLDVGVTRLRSNTPTDVPGASAGTVYVKHQGQWGTVCDDYLTRDDAQVICRSLGYSAGWVVPFYMALLGRGEGDVLVEKTACSGDEEWLGQCPSTELRKTFLCSHSEDAAVFCYDGGLEVRVGGGAGAGGRVEVRLADQWAGLCAAQFDDLDARVVCRMLGFNGDAHAIPGEGGGGRGAGRMWQLYLDCLGEEDNLQQCGLMLTNDTCYTAAAVSCSHTAGTLDAALRSLLPRDCGRAEDASTRFLTRLAKVRGGLFSSRFDEPWLASLVVKQSEDDLMTCGATIISEYLALTAAHCLELLGRLNLVLRVGDHNVNYKEEGEEEFAIDKIWEHEDFNVFTLNDNDIALLRVEPKNGRGIRFGARVQPLCLPRLADSYEELEDCTIAGWGRLRFNGTFPARPVEAKVKLMEDASCKQTLTGLQFSSSFVCTGGQGGVVNICKGDSGGPMACRVKGTKGPKALYAIASSGFVCRRNSPDAMTRVTKYLKWIYDKISSS